MDEKKQNYPSNVVDQEMDIGECSSEGEDEGEGDDEEEDEEEMDEEMESVDDEETEEEIAEEDDTVDDSLSVISISFNGNNSPHQAVPIPIYESSSPSNISVLN